MGFAVFEKFPPSVVLTLTGLWSFACLHTSESRVVIDQEMKLSWTNNVKIHYSGSSGHMYDNSNHNKYNNDCGRSKPHLDKRIVGGVKSDECEFPWVVMLNVGGAMCGGSLIDRRHVLTAAHCMENRTEEIDANSSVTGYGGSINLYNATKFTAMSWKRHPRRDPGTSFNFDVAVITLTEAVEYNRCLSPICLPTPEHRQDDEDECWTAGWGNDSQNKTSYHQRKVSLPLVNTHTCRRLYEGKAPVDVDATTVCAGDLLNGGIDTCQGDSGGPLMCESDTDRQYVQYGIVSLGQGCGQPFKPGVYTKVNHPIILSFILEAVQDVY